VLPEKVHLGPETVVGLGLLVFGLKLEDERHQRLGNEPTAEDSEAALFVGAGHEAVDQVVGHGASPFS
jgi:hypothetical protein